MRLAALLLAAAACAPSTEPDARIGVATVRDAAVAPLGLIRVRVSRSQAGTWYASACALRLQRWVGGAWADAQAQPSDCDPRWLPFGPGQDANFAVEMPFNSSDGPHRLLLFVLPYETGAEPIVTVAPIEEVRLATNSFEGIAFR